MEAKNLDIDLIDEGPNPRKDYDEEKDRGLEESIKEFGVKIPIIVTEIENGHFLLQMGTRRLRASKKVGCKTIPGVVVDAVDEGDSLTYQLIENLHRVNLNPIEEGFAYKKWMKKTKGNVKLLAKKISKPTDYIQRRLLLLDAHPDVQKALRTGKIKISHALILTRIKTKGDQKSLLGRVIKEKMFTDDIYWAINNITFSLNNADFDISNCAGCEHNGGEQTLLYGTGTELKGQCMDPACFKKKTEEHFTARRKQFESWGVEIISDPKDKRINWNSSVYFGGEERRKELMTDIEKNPGDYFVLYGKGDNRLIEETFYCTRKRERIGVQNTPEDRLAGKIARYKRGFLIRKHKEKLPQLPPNYDKSMVAYWLLKELSTHEAKPIFDTLKIKCDDMDWVERQTILKALLKQPIEVLDQVITKINQINMKSFYDEELEMISKKYKLVLKDEFKINETFLNLHTIDQLVDLAAELKIEVKKGKKTDMVKEILSHDLTGKVPKAFRLKLKT